MATISCSRPFVEAFNLYIPRVLLLRIFRKKPLLLFLGDAADLGKEAKHRAHSKTSTWRSKWLGDKASEDTRNHFKGPRNRHEWLWVKNISPNGILVHGHMDQKAVSWFNFDPHPNGATNRARLSITRDLFSWAFPRDLSPACCTSWLKRSLSKEESSMMACKTPRRSFELDFGFGSNSQKCGGRDALLSQHPVSLLYALHGHSRPASVATAQVPNPPDHLQAAWRPARLFPMRD